MWLTDDLQLHHISTGNRLDARGNAEIKKWFTMD